MKQFKFMLLFIAAAITSCSNDNTQPVATQYDFTGTWKLSEWKTGTSMMDISTCQEQYDYLTFISSTVVYLSFGEYVNNQCTQQASNNTFAVVDGNLEMSEIHTDNYVFDTKYHIIEATPTKLTIQLYWVRQSNPQGVLETETLPDNEKITYTYLKQ